MNFKCTIAVPTNRGINSKTFQSLLNLVIHGGYDFHIPLAEHGYTIAENRNYIAVQAINNKSDYLLMIDDDMIFPPDTLDALMANKKDIIGVAYHPRYEEGQIIKYLDDEVTIIKLEENDDPKYKKTFECKATGTGIILIKCDIFHKIPRPWFQFEWFDTGQCKLGEDWFFCREAKKAGYKIWTDPRIKVNHLGEKIY